MTSTLLFIVADLLLLVTWAMERREARHWKRLYEQEKALRQRAEQERGERRNWFAAYWKERYERLAQEQNGTKRRMLAARTHAAALEQELALLKST